MLRTFMITVSLRKLALQCTAHIISQQPHKADGIASLCYFLLCITNGHKFSELDNTNLLSYSSKGKTSKKSLAGIKSRCRQGCFFLVALEENLFPFSVMLWGEFSCLPLWDQGPHFLAGCQLKPIPASRSCLNPWLMASFFHQSQPH